MSALSHSSVLGAREHPPPRGERLRRTSAESASRVSASTRPIPPTTGERRLLAHAYNTSSDYTCYSFAKLSPDGRYTLFTSDMNGSSRSDLFLAELPLR